MSILHVLVVEDSENDAELMVMELRRSGWGIEHLRVDTADAMSAALLAKRWSIIIADYSMPNFSGPLALEMARARAPDVPFILVSGTVGEETAVAAMKAGADDYLFKGDLHRLVPVVEREMRGLEERLRARNTERLLHDREMQLGEALRMAKLGTWNFNLKSNCTDWSDEACLLLGKSSGATAPTFEQFLACMHADDRKTFNTSFSDASVTQIAQDCRLICVDSAAKAVHIRGRIVRDESGAPVVAGGMIQDITERTLIDAELLRLKDVAEAANRAKSEFLANMSHELRTPMSAILGFAEMMSHTSPDAPDHNECIQTIHRNANHLLELINEILDISKIEAGHMAVEKVRCDVPALLSEVVALMKSRAVEKSLDFNVAIDGPLPRYVLTDPLRLRQILVNLLGNAIKFTAAGNVEILVCGEQVGESAMLAIEIRDTGIGMTPDQLSRVFEPFAQAEQSTTRKFGGTGLGLAISQRLARLMNGTIKASSVIGVGTCFTVMVETGSIAGSETFSQLDKSVLVPADPAKSSADEKITAHVLLVEDGKDNQRLLTTHLKMAGATVDLAENGGIAVELASCTSYDLILMDMQMPVMDGYTATAELRQRGIDTTIIALTAYAMSEDRDKCLACGCNDYLSKPVNRELLLQTIRRHLGQAGRARVSAQNPGVAIAPEGLDATILRSTIKLHPGMAPIIIDFVRDLPEQVDQLQSLLLNKDTDALRRLVHQLRGSCGGYGFEGITEIAATAENAIKTGQSSVVISNCINSLIQIIQRIEGFDRRESRLVA